jgi:CheY-like chemotaxis protein
MPHAFDGNSFSRVLADAERLATNAIDQERRLTELVALMERAAASRSNGMSPDEWLDAIRQVCIAAGQQRQSAERMVNRLAVDVDHDRRAGRERRHVLVVDDSDDNRDIAAMVLEASGFHATTASNGLEGLIVAHYANPAVVLMDIAMPVLGGIESARLLKASEVTRSIPVIAYTATPITADGWLARLFAAVLRKPVGPDEIVAAVSRLAVADDARFGAS